MSSSEHLDGALLSGIAWTALMRWSSQALSWAATIVVARVLLPGEYGLVSMALIPIGLVRIAEDFGLDAILVQDRTIVGERQAELAGFVLAIGATLAAVCCALSSPIAAFFNEPQVAHLVSVLSLLFITDALQVVPRAMLQRRLAFSRLAGAFFVQVLATQGVLIATAMAGLGVWALVISNVAGGLVVTLLLWWWAPYAMRWPRRMRELARPLLQGSRVLVSRFAYYAYTTSDQTVIGRFLGKDALGAYSFTVTFANMPFQETSSIVTKVVPGVFSEIQAQRDELRRYFLTLTECLAFIILPMCVGLALTADLLVRTVLGPNWSAVVLPLQVMCGYSAFQGCQILIAPLLMWTGRFRALMWCSILTSVVLPLAFLAAVRHGLVAIALVWSIVYPLTNIPSMVIGLRIVRVSFAQWLETAKAAAVACVAMSAAVVGVRAALAGHPEIVRLAASVLTGALVYAAVLWLLFRSRVMALVDFVRSGWKPRTTRTLPDPA